MMDSLAIIQIAFVVSLFVWFVATSIYKGRLFDQRWPPISEDEFIARCRPGVNRQLALRVRRIIAEQLGVPYEQIYPEQDFFQDLDCD